MQGWHETYGPRGLVAWGVSINEDLEAARQYWQGQLGYTGAWAADPTFFTGQFFPGPLIGTPAWVVIDLGTMEIVRTQEGWSGEAAQIALFEPYLR